jgi:hypothetical protein
MHSSHVPTKLNVDVHASLGGIDNITDHTWKPPQTLVILDLELECIWDTLKPTFPNDLVKLLSDCIKEHALTSFPNLEIQHDGKEC